MLRNKSRAFDFRSGKAEQASVCHSHFGFKDRRRMKLAVDTLTFEICLVNDDCENRFMGKIITGSMK